MTDLSPHKWRRRDTVNSRLFGQFGLRRCESHKCWGRTLDQTDPEPYTGSVPGNQTSAAAEERRLQTGSAVQSTSYNVASVSIELIKQ